MLKSKIFVLMWLLVMTVFRMWMPENEHPSVVETSTVEKIFTY